MAAFNIGGDWTFSGADFTINDSNNITLNCSNILNIGDLSTSTVGLGSPFCATTISGNTSVVEAVNGLTLTTVNGLVIIDTSDHVGLGVNIGVSTATKVNIGNASCATQIDATSFNLQNAPNAAAGAGVYVNSLLGANQAYLVIDTVTGFVTSVTPS